MIDAVQLSRRPDRFASSLDLAVVTYKPSGRRNDR